MYGITTSVDVAKLQPWQLRILKREFDFIDGIYLYAFRSYGSRFMIDINEHKRNEQFNSPAIWLEYNVCFVLFWFGFFFFFVLHFELKNCTKIIKEKKSKKEA